MRLIDAEPIIKSLSAMKTQLGYDAIDIDGMIKALREAEEVTNSDSPNDPLTLQQLREMDGEPVWTITLSVEGSGRWELCTCEVVTACPLHKVLRCVTAMGEMTDYELDTYGKTWFAYRRKPEEGTACV